MGKLDTFSHVSASSPQEPSEEAVEGVLRLGVLAEVEEASLGP